MSSPEQVLARSKALLEERRKEETQKLISESGRQVRQARELADKYDQQVKGEELLKVLPQGEGSGLDADTVDGLHASEIVAKARTSGGASGSVSEGVKAHKPTHVNGGSDAFNGETDELSFQLEQVAGLPAAVRGRLVYLVTDGHAYLGVE